MGFFIYLWLSYWFNLGLALLLVLLGGFFYRSYKVYLSLIKVTIVTILYKLVTKSVVILRQLRKL